MILAESGALNAVFSWFGIGPFTMLNTPFGTIVGYMTLTLPLVVVLQTLSLANVNRDLKAAWNRCGMGS